MMDRSRRRRLRGRTPSSTRAIAPCRSRARVDPTQAGARLDVLVFADLPLDPRLVAFATGPRYAPLQVGLIWPHFALSTSLSNVDYYLLPGDLALRDGDATKHGDRFGEQLVFLDGVGHSILSDPPGVDVLKPPSRSRHARPGPFFDARSGARERATARRGRSRPSRWMDDPR